MELDDLKRSWEQYDQRLTENLRLNKELLRRSTLDRSRREMNAPMHFTGFNLASVPIFFLFALRWTLMYGREPLYLICGIVVMVACLLSLAVDLKGMALLRRIDYDNTPILELQKQLTTFWALYNKDKKIGICLLPVLLAAALILIVKGVHRVEALDNLRYFIVTMSIMLAISYPLMIWIVRAVYDKKVRSAQRFLTDLKAFEKEE
jgi:hypothetical protein